MRAPRWLRTLARRKSGEQANVESARQLNNYFAPGGFIQGPVEGHGSDAVPYSFGEHGHSAVDPATFLAELIHRQRSHPVTVAVDEIMALLKPPLRSEVQSIIARVYAAGIANREEGSQ
jgi:hypothetical protein